MKMEMMIFYLDKNLNYSLYLNIIFDYNLN